jgi:CubicO group peptidase (beta-lactamase class C family)
VSRDPVASKSGLLAALAVVCAGCGSGRWTLHAQGGDQFGVAANDASGPTSIDCPGTTDQRFACFIAKLRARSAGRSGVFAIVTAEGRIQTAVNKGDGAPSSLADNEPFAVGSITKMFVAAAAVSLAQEGKLD